MGIDDNVEARITQNQTWKFYLSLTGNEKGFMVDPLFSFSHLHLKILNPSGTVVASDLSTSVTKSLTIGNPVAGNWTIIVYGNSIPGAYDEFKLTTKHLELPPEQSGSSSSGTGGINFTSLNLNYISTCDSNEISFVMKGKEANISAGDTIINITNATINAMDYFLTGLVIPNDKQWISLVFESSNGELLFLTFVQEHPVVDRLSEGRNEAL